MASRYHARDRTVLKNSRNGLREENLRTKESVSVGMKEKEMLFGADSGNEDLSHKKADKTVRKRRGGYREAVKDMDGVESPGNTAVRTFEHGNNAAPAGQEMINPNGNDGKGKEASYHKKQMRKQYRGSGADGYHQGKAHSETVVDQPAFRESSLLQEVYKDHDGDEAVPWSHTSEVDDGDLAVRDKVLVSEYSGSRNRGGRKGNQRYPYNKRREKTERHQEKKNHAHSDKLSFSDEDNPKPKRKTGRGLLRVHATKKAFETMSAALDYSDDKHSETDEMSGGLIDGGIAATRIISARPERMKERRFASKKGFSRLRFGEDEHHADEGSMQSVKDRQKAFQKKHYQRQYGQPKKPGEWFVKMAAGDTGTNAAKQAPQGMARKAMEAISGGKKSVAITAGLFVLVIIMAMSAFSGCVALTGGLASVLSTTYPGADGDIRDVDAAYSELERKLDGQVNTMESTHPGYDEYRYQVDEITHNPFQLASLLTAKFGNYTPEDLEEELPAILNLQYTLTVTEEAETRTRTVTDPDTGEETEEEYDYCILNISLTNHGLEDVAKQYLSDEQYRLYQSLCATKGNRKELFDEEGITASPGGGAGGAQYDIPPEALSDERFVRMITEAEKYLGYPYVWGGASPATSFDCSGFVSWVINNSGNGWNYGRRTAEGLRQLCSPVRAEDAKPGDLIFFQGTYAASGASHVGIYVGNGMMIHCGDPIQYAGINTPYWRQHFYMFGRLP